MDEDDDELPQLSQDGFATSMPGYQDEEVEADHGVEDEAIEAEETNGRRTSASTSSRPDFKRPPNSSNHASGNGSKPSSTASTSTAPQKPISRGIGGPGASRSPQEDPGGLPSEPVPLLECPICGKMLEADNQGLNEHIDFCLSKGAIKEAQASSLSLKPGTGSGNGAVSGPSRRGHKPPSKGRKDKGGGGHGDGLLRFRKAD